MGVPNLAPIVSRATHGVHARGSPGDAAARDAVFIGRALVPAESFDPQGLCEMRNDADRLTSAVGAQQGIHHEREASVVTVAWASCRACQSFTSRLAVLRLFAWPPELPGIAADEYVPLWRAAKLALADAELKCPRGWRPCDGGCRAWTVLGARPRAALASAPRNGARCARQVITSP